MFDKFQQLRQMQELSKQLSQERAEVEKEGVKVVMNGSFEVEEVRLSGELPREKQEELLKEALNEARTKLQRTIAQKFGGMI